MFLEPESRQAECKLWKEEDEKGRGHFEKKAVPNQIILFSEQPCPEHYDLIRWLEGLHYEGVICKTFWDMCQHLEKGDRAEDGCVAVLIDSEADYVKPDGAKLEGSRSVLDGFLYSDQKLCHLMTKWPHLRLIALTNGSPLIQNRLGHLIRQGLIYDFHSLPVDRTRLFYCLGHIQGLTLLERSPQSRLLKKTSKGYGQLIGTSPKMQRIYNTINRIDGINVPVLITGENGTGKEVVAKTIHKHSPYCNGPFVAINCAALPENLIESELFGHEAGAFTGAVQRKIGKVELADNGTLFLDEIGDMPVDLQTRFLRFLQDSSFERVGGLKSLKIKTRIIAATNVNLQDAINKGTFREDLYYRLNVISIHVPPLRDRCEDVRLLADSYLEKFRITYRKPRLDFTHYSYELMNKYDWPGNVRELINAVRRATILAKNRFLKPENLGLKVSLEDVRKTCVSLSEARADFDRQFIHATLIRNNFNISKAADELQTSRVSLYRLIKKLDIDNKEQVALYH